VQKGGKGSKAPAKADSSSVRGWQLPVAIR